MNGRRQPILGRQCELIEKNDFLILDIVPVDPAIQTDLADPSGSQVEQARASQPASANHQDRGLLQRLLPGHPDVGQHQMV